MAKSRKPFDCVSCDRSFKKAGALADHRKNVHGIVPVCEQVPVVTCDYCGASAILTSGAVIYPGRTDLSAKQMYRCEPCGAHVGCHPGTINPLGRLANAQLRRAKQDAHQAFDPLWTAKMQREKLSKGRARSRLKWASRNLTATSE